MGERNYQQMIRETERLETTDKLLEELQVLLGEEEKIKAEMASSLIEKSDSENREEQHQNIAVVNRSYENPLSEKLKENQKKIDLIKTKLSANQK